MKISRRAVFGAAALLAAFGGNVATAQTPAQRDADTLIYLHPVEPASLAQSWTEANYPKRQILDSLVYLDNESELRPWLATSWNQDGTVWTFKLRDDVKFRDGTKLDAATVVKNFYFWLKISTAMTDYFFKEAKAVDEYTVEFHTVHPQPYLINILSSAGFGIHSLPSLDRDLKDIGENPIGSGPFYLKEWKRGEELVLERNEDYRWGPQGTHGGPAHLKTIRWQFVPDGNTRWLALERGQADLVRDPPLTQWKQAQQKYLTSQRLEPGRNQTLSLNVEQGPFADKRIRQAFAYASNRQQIVETVFRGAVPFEGNGAYSRNTADYLDLDQAYPHDLDKAIALLKEAGYDSVNAEGYRVDQQGKVLEVVFPLNPLNVLGEGVTAAQALQAEVKKAGIKLDLVLLTQTDLAAGRYTKVDEYDIRQGYWTLPAPTVLAVNYRPAGDAKENYTSHERQRLNQYVSLEGNPNPHNVVRSSDWELQASIVAAHYDTDPSARKAKWQAIQQHISDEALALGFYASAYNLVGQKYVTGLVHNIIGPVFYEVRKQ